MENRSEPRVPHAVRFFVNIHDSPEEPELIGMSVACEAIDFSPHGLQFRSETELRSSATLNITVGLGEPFAMYLLRGEIRWVRMDNGLHYVGIILHDEDGTDYPTWTEDFEEIKAALDAAQADSQPETHPDQQAEESEPLSD